MMNLNLLTVGYCVSTSVGFPFSHQYELNLGGVCQVWHVQVCEVKWR